MPEVRRLLLWDVDGTLVRTGAVGRRALEEAAAQVAELADVPTVEMSGKTDPQILREIFAAAEVDDERIDALLPGALRAAEEALARAEEEMRATGRVLPGVAELLQRLAATPGVRQTLLTGNLVANAAVKVAAFGLADWFDAAIGAYGSDHADRLELVPIALERAARFRGETYAPSEVWVIGDTANDLACARAGGVCCLLVGTGAFGPVDRLDADATLPDLADVDRAYEILIGPPAGSAAPA